MDSGKKYRVGYTTGVFDMFHIGHLNILRRAKELCDTLIVGVTTDQLCYERKGKYPVICEADRIAIISSIKYVDRVVLQVDMNKVVPIKQLAVDVVFVGSDWKGTPEWEAYEAEFQSVGCSVVYLEHTEGISSSILRKRLEDAN